MSDNIEHVLNDVLKTEEILRIECKDAMMQNYLF
jgi:hypothetical protein